MRKIALLLVAATLGSACHKRAPFEQRGIWAQSLEVPFLGGDVVDAQGNSYFIGAVAAAQDLTGEAKEGGWDLFLAKMDASGHEIWRKRYGDRRDQRGYGGAVTAGGWLVIHGTFQGVLDLTGQAKPLETGLRDQDFLAAIDPATGQGVWSKSLDLGPDAGLTDLAVDPSDGAIVVVGSASKPINLGGGLLGGTGSTDVIVAKFDKKGAHQWSTRFPGAGDQGARRVAIDGGGAIYLVGAYNYTMTVGSDELPQATKGPRVFLTKMDRQGNARWTRTFSATGRNELNDLLADANGVLLAGTVVQGALELGAASVRLETKDRASAFVAAFDGEGQVRWARNFSSNLGECVGKTIALDDAGNAWLGGHFMGDVRFGGRSISSANKSRDLYVAKLDLKTGEPSWAMVAGDAGEQAVSSISIDAREKTAYVAGIFTGQLDFGAKPAQLSNATNDFHSFVMKFAL